MYLKLEKDVKIKDLEIKKRNNNLNAKNIQIHLIMQTCVLVRFFPFYAA